MSGHRQTVPHERFDEDEGGEVLTLAAFIKESVPGTSGE
jgi:hypothetical protein